MVASNAAQNNSQKQFAPFRRSRYAGNPDVAVNRLANTFRATERIDSKFGSLLNRMMKSIKGQGVIQFDLREPFIFCVEAAHQRHFEGDNHEFPLLNG